jgi:hypothetical protein
MPTGLVASAGQVFREKWKNAAKSGKSRGMHPPCYNPRMTTLGYAIPANPPRYWRLALGGVFLAMSSITMLVDPVRNVSICGPGAYELHLLVRFSRTFLANSLILAAIFAFASTHRDFAGRKFRLCLALATLHIFTAAFSDIADYLVYHGFCESIGFLDKLYDAGDLLDLALQLALFIAAIRFLTRLKMPRLGILFVVCLAPGTVLMLLRVLSRSLYCLHFLPEDFALSGAFMDFDTLNLLLLTVFWITLAVLALAVAAQSRRSPRAEVHIPA